MPGAGRRRADLDVGSLTGTWVNRVPVDFATLAYGDRTPGTGTVRH